MKNRRVSILSAMVVMAAISVGQAQYSSKNLRYLEPEQS